MTMTTMSEVVLGGKMIRAMAGCAAVARDAATGIVVDRGGRTPEEAAAGASRAIARAVCNHYRALCYAVRRAAEAVAAHPRDAGRHRAWANAVGCS